VRARLPGTVHSWRRVRGCRVRQDGQLIDPLIPDTRVQHHPWYASPTGRTQQQQQQQQSQQPPLTNLYTYYTLSPIQKTS
jgi:hypothetical protein